MVDAGNTAAYRNFFLSEGEGWIIGSAFFSGNVVTKIEAGLPTGYHYFSDSPDSFNISLDFRDGQTGIIGNTNGQVYRTVDGGNSWAAVQAATANTAIHAIRFLNNNTVLAATDGVLLISHDAGLTWDTDMNNLTFDYPVMKSIALSKKDSFITVGSGVTNPNQGLIYWHDHIFNQREVVNQPLHSVAMANDSVAYAVGDSGLIVTNRTAAVVGINDPLLLEAQLKIYPNPNGGKFFVELPYQHTLTIYDYNGKSVLKESHKALRHCLDISPLPKGVYLVELNVAGKRISRKIIYK